MLHIIGRGLISPLGDNAETSHLMFKAGINQYRHTSIYSRSREPLTCCFVPDSALPRLSAHLESTHALSPAEKHVARLCHKPLNECLGRFSRNVPVPLFLSVPESLASRCPNLRKNLMAAIALQSNLRLDPVSSRILSSGRCGGLHALTAAIKYLDEADNDFALVGGVETFHGCHDRLSHLEWEGRLLTRTSLEGFVPGEAASFLLLCSDRALQKYQPKKYLTIYAPGVSEEPGHLYSETVYTGEALAKAVSLAFVEAPKKMIDSIYSTLNGESFWTKEFGIAALRNSVYLSENINHIHPADCFGDIGAASAPVFLSLICEDQSTNHSALWCASDMAPRAALYVRK